MSKVGRPVGWRKAKSEIRPQHQVRAYPDEWQIIKKFADLVKYGDKQAAKILIEKMSEGRNHRK